MIPCPACQSKNTEFLFDMGWQPLSLVDMKDNPDESHSLEPHAIRLSICHNCCHVFNEAFDPNVEQYSGAGCRMYNNGSNWQYHVDVIRNMLATLPATTVVEVGAGDCTFLASISPAVSNCEMIAVDPCEALAEASKNHPDIKCIREYFDADKHIPEDAGSTLIVMRHLLEHMEQPRQFLADIVDVRRSKNQQTWLYIEVPCASKALRNCRVEDWTYEHPQHFTETSLAALLRGLGLVHFNAWTTYGDEVLCCLAYIGTEKGFDSDEILCNYDRVGKSITQISEWIQENADNIVFWGGAGKSAMFLNLFLVDVAGSHTYTPCEAYGVVPGLPTIVDSHDAKWGLYVPGTRLRIQPPSVLWQMDKPPIIIATTSWRADDIAAEIARDYLPCERLLKFANGKLMEVPLG